MYIYIVKSTELLNYIGHGLYNEAEHEHGVYSTNEQAKKRVKELHDEDGIEARIESRWIEQ